MAKKTFSGNGFKSKISEKLRKRMWLVCYLLALAGVSVFSFRCLLISRVPTGSMETAIMPGDYVFASRLAYRSRSPEHGDIVLFHKDGTFLCKRVVAVGGEAVSFRGGCLYLNGEMADEPYIKGGDADSYSLREFDVPEGSCFVLGDNREESYDARYWEEPYVSYSDLIAEVLFVIPMHWIRPAGNNVL